MLVSIRPYVETDRQALLEIFHENIPVYFAEHELKEYQNYLSSHPKTYCTVTLDGRIIGGAGYIIDTEKHTGSITWIFISTKSKGKGAGSTTVRSLMDKMLRLHDIETFEVRTSQYAFKFFERLGFKTTKTEKDYWAKGIDLVEMRLVIKKKYHE